MKTFMLISSCSIFLTTRKNVHSMMMKTKKLIGKIKDELDGAIIEELVDLRAKMYSLKTNKEEMKKAKRVKKNVVKKDISHQEYVDFLFEERKFIHTMQSI